MLIGGPGDDTLLGGAGNDRISGGPGAATSIAAGDGNDTDPRARRRASTRCTAARGATA